MAIDADLVCTDADLEGYTLGKANLQALLPDEWLNDAETEKTAKPARQQVLNDVLEKLSKRTPPILEDDIADKTDLRNVVAYGTLALVFLNAPTREGSPNFKRSEFFQKRYDAEMSNLLIVTTDDEGEGGGGATSNLNVEVARA